MDRLRKALRERPEQIFVLVVIATAVLLNYVLQNKLAFLQFYFIPVIIAGYIAGIRLSVLGAVFCILMVLIYAIIYTQQFLTPQTPETLGLYILTWGSFLVIAGYTVGSQRDKLNTELERTVNLKTKLEDSYSALESSKATTILGLAKLAEYRDDDTGKHLERIMSYSRIIATELSREYTSYITKNYINDLCLSSILHDIGKVGIPDAILQKPGGLTDDEFEMMKSHTTLGGDALNAIEEKIEGRSFLTLGKEVAYNHHERWDGGGYPNGLKGEDIPLSARIVSIVDTYDAITSDRVYRPARSHEVAMEIIESEKGKQFDPRIVDAFLKNAKEFAALREELQEPCPIVASA